jgi:hypothetical protein
MTVLCLCQEDNHRKILPAYAQAFRNRGVQFLCIDRVSGWNSSLEEVLKTCPEKPDCIFHFESDFPFLPEGLVQSEIPTVCFHVDTYAFTERRMRWSSLFDHVAVFHSGYETLFQKHGHPGAFLLPHAVRREFFEARDLPREFEVGWVGQTEGMFYRKRAEWVPRLASAFRMNDWKGRYSLQEVAEVYRRSRLVVNIGRDDFPQDANMRVFEVLASGALLVTSMPSELSDMGFEEGVHFIGYQNPDEIIRVIRHFLKDEPARAGIAQAARAKVLQEHTYDRRADQLIAHLKVFGQKKLAPARHWSEARVRLAYLDFFAAHGLVDCAEAQYRRIAGHGFSETMEGAVLLGKAWLKKIRASNGSAV